MKMKVSKATQLFLLAATLFTRGTALPLEAATPAATPVPVTLGGIIHPDSDDTLAFTPDGNTVFFDRSDGKHKTIMVSHKVDGRWSQPRVARFSGHWYDQDPALSPDGSYLVFSSDRPVVPGGKRLIRDVDGKAYHGGNLWKVEWRGSRWGAPMWLGPTVNQSPFLVSPSIAADGTLYFIQRGDDRAMHIYRSPYRGARYLPPTRVSLGDPSVSTHDPAIAPDGSFIVFGYGKTAAGLGRLCIAFHEGDHWSQPIDLGDAVNAVGPWGSHVTPNGRAITFTGNSAIYRLALEPWLRGRAAVR
jgi:Tol biopolymer transport system component